jgi:hypothetical protein
MKLYVDGPCVICHEDTDHIVTQEVFDCEGEMVGHEKLRICVDCYAKEQAKQTPQAESLP